MIARPPPRKNLAREQGGELRPSSHPRLPFSRGETEGCRTRKVCGLQGAIQESIQNTIIVSKRAHSFRTRRCVGVFPRRIVSSAKRTASER